MRLTSIAPAVSRIPTCTTIHFPSAFPHTITFYAPTTAAAELRSAFRLATPRASTFAVR